MAIPDYQTIMLSLLKYSGDDDEHSVREAVESLAEDGNVVNLCTCLKTAI